MNKVSPWIWLKKNLFSTWYNAVLTLISLLFIYWIGLAFIEWALTLAQWRVIEANLKLLFVGYYPQELLWLTWTTLGAIVGLGGFSWGILSSYSSLLKRKSLVILGIICAVFISVAFSVDRSNYILLSLPVILVAGYFLGKQLKRLFPELKSWLALIWLLSFFVLLWFLLEPIGIDRLSGLLLTISVALISILLCFPFGVLLALGRQSDLPAIRWLSVAYIEIIRGLPLIGILFMTQVMLPLVLPSNLQLSQVITAIAGFTLFTGAYVAENVRGGLQSIPRGQTEAAKALGLSPPFVIVLIILPQALRAVIPSLVGQFISLFKDTSLMAIVGLVDLLGISQSILANPKYLGRSAELYLFLGLIYWVCCYSMSIASRRLEK
ncbi:MAG: amino acid ABC transporter permease [Prochloraceae cyanobacterium]|nr:amino acid ABC transporter permease [Prochloraceae cyanobacterium]